GDAVAHLGAGGPARFDRSGAGVVLARRLRAIQAALDATPRLAGQAGGSSRPKPPPRRRRSRRHRRGTRAPGRFGGRRRALPQRRAVAEAGMILAVDCGNSRLKWGLHGGDGWLRTGTVPLSGIEKLKNAWTGIAPAARIVVANVAGPSVQRRLEKVLS